MQVDADEVPSGREYSSVLVTTTSAAAATAHDIVLDRRDSSKCVYVVELMHMDITAIQLKCVIGWVA
jgi:hypothetical protein